MSGDKTDIIRRVLICSLFHSIHHRRAQAAISTCRKTQNSNRCNFNLVYFCIPAVFALFGDLTLNDISHLVLTIDAADVSTSFSYFVVFNNNNNNPCVTKTGSWSDAPKKYIENKKASRVAPHDNAICHLLLLQQFPSVNCILFMCEQRTGEHSHYSRVDCVDRMYASSILSIKVYLLMW